MRAMRHLGGLALTALLLAGPATAANITIVNVDGAGEGFNDGTITSPVGGNNGTTIGQQRLKVFQHAAALWGAILPSTVTIVVEAKFDPLTCTATTGVLGQAGPKTVHANFTGAEFTNVWYHQALANKLAGVDVSLENDIQATFSSTLGDPNCLGGTEWYYGFDHNEGSRLDLLAVVLHELGHGLGFSTTTNPSSGAYLSTLPGLWDRFLYDRNTALHWNQMTAAQRVASAISTGNLVWDGHAVTLMVPQMLGPSPEVRVNAPANIVGSYGVGTAQFGAPLSTDGVTGNVVLANDGTGTSSDGCEPFINGAMINGNVALVDRGTCTFVQKVQNAQNAGAIAAIVVDNGSGLSGMTGYAPSIVIPSVMVSQSDGNTIRNKLGSGVNVTLRLNPTQLAGASPEGKARMYAPNQVQSGSSVSHFDAAASPNLLMEPAINSDLTDNVDLTRYLLEDIGWLARTTSVPPTGGPGPALALRGVPNPFRSGTALHIELAGAGMVDLAVFDLAGRPVRHLVSAWMPAGTHTVAWDGSDASGRRVAPGVYLTRLKANGATVSRPVVRIE